MKNYISIYILVLLMLIIGCGKPVKNLFVNGYVKHSTGPRINESFYKKNEYTIEFSTKENKKIQLRYLGCGGYYIANENSGILIDPFFSNKSFWSIPFSRIKSKQKNVKFALNDLKDDIKYKVNSIFVSHSHYDHLLDVPYIYENYTDTNLTKIYCSVSGKDRISHVVNTKNIVYFEDSLVTTWYRTGIRYFIPNSKNTIRVTPIMAAHAPHTKKLRLYSGECKPDPGYNKSTEKTWPGKWKQGTTYSYVVDFMYNPDSVEFRILIQSSAAPPKYGWINEQVLAEHKINITILCAATYNTTKEYPEGLINHLNPEKVIICHWEDFFVRYKRKKKKTVRFTNVNEFIYSLNSVFPYKIDGIERFTMPNPGVDITVAY